MKIKKSVVLLIIPVLILASISVNLSSIQSLLSSSNDINEVKTIILDAGHPELVGHYRFSDLPPNMQIFKNRTTVRFFGILGQNSTLKKVPKIYVLQRQNFIDV